MTEPAAEHPLPPSVARVLSTFRALGREEKMQALLHYAKKLEPVPERFLALDRAQFNVPECQTRVDLFPEMRAFLASEEGRRLYTIGSRGFDAERIGAEVVVGEGLIGAVAARCESARVGNLRQMAKYSASSVRRRISWPGRAATAALKVRTNEDEKVVAQGLGETGHIGRRHVFLPVLAMRGGDQDRLQFRPDAEPPADVRHVGVRRGHEDVVARIADLERLVVAGKDAQPDGGRK